VRREGSVERERKSLEEKSAEVGGVRERRRREECVVRAVRRVDIWAKRRGGGWGLMMVRCV